MSQARSVSPRFRRLAFVAAVVFAAVAVACNPVSEIVLVIDTDLEIGTEIDRVEITAIGPSGPVMDIPAVDLLSAKTPTLPLTLGLVDGGTASSVSITVVGKFGEATAGREEIHTAFLPGAKKVLRVVLSASCRGITCGDAQTCRLGKCVSSMRPADDLPAWEGVPGSVHAEPDLDVSGVTLWTGGWRSCASKGPFIYCWGENDRGQFGNGRAVMSEPARIPFPALPNKLKAIALGYKHTCVCDVTGLVWCWGNNEAGQVGSMGSVTPTMGQSVPIQFTPVVVPEIDDCRSIAAGGWHTCAIRKDLGVWCWGRNAEGQLGQAATTSPSPVPQRVPSVNNITDVQAGEWFTCVLGPSGVVQCWGDNLMGQLGDGKFTSRPNPVRVMLPTDVSDIALGRYFACVRFQAGKVSCWGENNFGMSGSGPTNNPTPTKIEGLENATLVRLGHQHGCALRTTGVTSCWGSGQNGRLGDGQGTGSVTPVDVSGLAGVTELTVGMTHSCARKGREVFCWGQNILNQLGDGTGSTQMTPVKVIGF